MNINSAFIYSSGASVFDKRIGGLFLLERNIRILWHAGVKDVVLDLNDNEKDFYDSVVLKRIKNLKDIKIRSGKESLLKKAHFKISSTDFIELKYLLKHDQYFAKKGISLVPSKTKDIFCMKTPALVKKAEALAVENIRLSAGGFISANINKRLSLPMSLVLSRLGIHPNVLTTISLMLAIVGGALLWFGSYWNQFIAAMIFQFISIFDGCDGEVAKLNGRFSKFGAAYDTINDYFCLLYFVVGLGVVFYHSVSLPVFVTMFSVSFGGLLIMIGAIAVYIVRFSLSNSFVAYQRDFMSKLPYSDPFVWIANKLQYFARKEFYSWLVFFAAFPGWLYMMIPYLALTVIVGAVALVMINFRYFKTLPKGKRTIEMTYISQRR